MEKATYGLVGYPLGHSLSPVMHNTAFRALGVDAEYKLFPMPREDVEPFFRSLKQPASPVFGLNVTIPHKETVMPLLDAVDPFAHKVGAVNTVTIDQNRRLTGYNTDGPGFLAHLTEEGFQPRGKRIAILGAGGAARAVAAVFCLLPERPESIRIFDVERPRAEALAADLGQRLDTTPLRVVATKDDLNIELADLLINATPVGMKPGDPRLVLDEQLHNDMMVYDLVYNPAQTELLKQAASRGAKAVNGLRMLFYQGVLAFQHWAEQPLPEQVKASMWSALHQACYPPSV